MRLHGCPGSGRAGFGFTIDNEGRVVKKPQVAGAWPTICGVKEAGVQGAVHDVSKSLPLIRKLPRCSTQLLRVFIGDDVEVGANSCIDRGSWRDTVIGDCVKIDNLVQIGHNVVIGRCCLLCGQVGLGGSSTLGDYVILGGKAGVADHMTICSKVRVAAKAGVMRDITEPGDYAGFPAVPAREWRKAAIAFRQMGRSTNIKIVISTIPQKAAGLCMSRGEKGNLMTVLCKHINEVGLPSSVSRGRFAELLRTALGMDCASSSWPTACCPKDSPGETAHLPSIPHGAARCACQTRQLCYPYERLFRSILNGGIISLIANIRKSYAHIGTGEGTKSRQTSRNMLQELSFLWQQYRRLSCGRNRRQPELVIKCHEVLKARAHWATSKAPAPRPPKRCATHDLGR
eukprot:SM000263S09816  [mRNA]  locus=s263:88317:96187:- [translate_table: standard]